MDYPTVTVVCTLLDSTTGHCPRLKLYKITSMIVGDMFLKAEMNVQLFGQGTINGSLAPNNEEYKFMIWAADDNPDTVRIKIWWEDNSGENIVYDNDMQQPIEGGAIQVHAYYPF